ncbi:ClpXP protease specificity-enhancing factor SspB [Anaplasma capra]|uniref:ClpXP protease specificity-enhancing factor SspB n=1 Tax=Anaplasma capra TaxID=1562740 RepID=UPI0021D5E202|nr:ClpXP protease specificity-enhancing factor SspB [Anaplasma capra]MCU7611490.1 ClpXP protease specificity-enhancing factor SspB [Anaplasma capra]MCU7612071.1 ClpXP protease specificity-enhancing factor SspB [Anaplasma capra]
MSDLVDYRRLVYSAMCSVVREALDFVSKLSPSGEAHITISFLTGCSGVVLPDHLRAQYPENMTIVLQYQFRELSVSEHCFKVILSFRGKEECITVPFRAIIKYVDMLANFSLDLEQYGDVELGVDLGSDNDDVAEDSSEGTAHTVRDNIIFIDKFLKN